MMTGDEYFELTHYALAYARNVASHPSQWVGSPGMHALAVELGCSDSMVYALMRTPREEDNSAEGSGILKSAIVSCIGRRIVFDVDTTRRLVDEYQNTENEHSERRMDDGRKAWPQKGVSCL